VIRLQLEGPSSNEVAPSLTDLMTSWPIGVFVSGMTPIFRSSLDGRPDRQRGWRKDEHHDHSSKEVP